MYPLQLSVITDQFIYKLQYAPPLTINIAGNLTLDGVPVSDGLVAVTVFQGNLSNYIRPVLFRTLNTGSIPSQDWSFRILSLEAGSWNGSAFTPQTIFKRPSTQLEPGPVFNITYNNVDYKAWVYLTLTLFDSEKVPITTRIMRLEPVPADTTFSVITDSIPLENWVALGTASAYVCAFDNIPPYIYFPYCPEVSTQFEIVSNLGSMSLNKETPKNNEAPNIHSISGNYNLTFKINYYMSLPVYSPWGNYTVKVSSKYQGQQAINSQVFWVKIPGDVNGDSIVNVLDATLIGLYWMQSVPPAPANVDTNDDQIINIFDASVIGLYWMRREAT